MFKLTYLKENSTNLITQLPYSNHIKVNTKATENTKQSSIKKKVFNISNSHLNEFAIKQPVNRTKLSKTAYNILNTTLVGDIDIPRSHEVELKVRKWDFKLIAKQIEDIIVDMNFANMKGVNAESMRSFQHLFITSFEQCDINVDNLLSLKEFTKCLKTDIY